MYFALLSFITNPVLIAAYLMCVTTYSFALTGRPSINTASAYAVYCLVLLKILHFTALNFLSKIEKIQTQPIYADLR
jgi:hypothetical protein